MRMPKKIKVPGGTSAPDITDRKRMEEALQQSEHNLKTYLESAPDGVYLSDLKGKFLYGNKKAEELTGYEREELVGKSFLKLNLLPAKHLAKAGKLLALNAMGRPTGPDEFELIRKDGSRIWVEINTAPIKQGGKTEVIGFVRDITERKRMEHDLGERMKELQCLYGIARIAERPEISLDELYQEVVNLLPSSWQYPEVTCARIAINGKESKTENYRDTEWKQSSAINVYGTKAGEVEVSYLEERPGFDEGPFLKEERWLIDAVAQRLGDITERKRAEEKLREGEENLRSLLDSMEDLVFALDKKGTFQSYDQPSHIDKLYVPPSEFIGKHFGDVLPPDVAERLQAAMEEMETSGKTQQFEYRLEMAGEEKWSDARVSPIRDSSGDITGITVVSRDITERKRMERELQERNERLDAQNEELQSQSEELMTQQQELMEKTREVEKATQLKSEFLANMSHELRTPLNVIIGFSQLMVDEVPGEINEEQRQSLSDILDSSQSLLNLINEVLDLSKIESGKMELKPKDIALTEVIKSLTRTMMPILAPRKQSLDIEIEEGLPPVCADKAKLGQVLLNLVDNSSKFTPDGGKLKIEAVRKGDWCRVSVIDNGVGIKKEDQERIFEPFCRLDDPLTKGRGGTGLGLVLVKQIVERYGGRIWVESEHGKGSRFTVTVSLAASGQPNPEERDRR